MIYYRIVPIQLKQTYIKNPHQEIVMKKNTVITLLFVVFGFICFQAISTNIEPRIISKQVIQFQYWGATDITIYGIPCKTEIKKFKSPEDMAKWTLNNVKIVKDLHNNPSRDTAIKNISIAKNEVERALWKNTVILYETIPIIEFLDIILKTHYNEKGAWQNIRVTSIELTQEKQ